ncbi:MAG: LPS export ABC transporter periplasmic protein LptC [Elusimicrobiales bacterium]|nr:LPS export ABC transporter periplasmic protein LptC [Elusimicrobiales bacterium]HOJ86825.1 LPS export ABC transporter periplasmic protein LptC [Elusimicrobiales bacterium]HOL63549.1 LPS export ABC transporter periplasmic protein LptC [Elusimicrobiales bacterium]HPO95260.1 LPS export ABC transporter periplasmic protein LptC [Elusimicrobiales bacterium]
MTLNYKTISFKLLVNVCFFFFLISCSGEKEEKSFEETSMKKFFLTHMKNSEKKWDLYCSRAFLDQKQDKIKCYSTEISVYSDSAKISQINSKTGFGELSKESFYLKDGVKIISYSQGLELYCEKVYFDSQKEKIYSDLPTTVIKKKENVEIKSMGFEARSDLSNIKFFKHTTRKI